MNNSDFWSKYPKDKAGFDKCVRKGIYINFDLEHVEGDGLKSEYNGVSTHKLRSYYKSWKEEHDKFISEKPLHISKAMFAFEKDYEEDTKKAEVEFILKEAIKLPIPPEGYYWEEDNGGIICRYNRAYPMTYRLWNNKLGYMPKSE